MLLAQSDEPTPAGPPVSLISVGGVGDAGDGGASGSVAWVGPDADGVSRAETQLAAVASASASASTCAAEGEGGAAGSAKPNRRALAGASTGSLVSGCAYLLPRDAFKFLYACLNEHCSNVTSQEQSFRVPRLVLESVRRQQAERVQQLYRGIGPA